MKNLKLMVKETLEELDNQWADYVGSLEYTFPAIRKGNKFYNFGGREIMDNRYTKFSEFDALHENEKKFIIWDYHRLLNKIEKINETLSC